MFSFSRFCFCYAHNRRYRFGGYHHTAFVTGDTYHPVSFQQCKNICLLCKRKVSVASTVTPGEIAVFSFQAFPQLYFQDGIVVVVFTIDGYSDQLLSGPDIISRGFVYVKESEALISEARLAARSVIEKYESYDYKDWSVIKSKIRDQVSTVLYKKTKRSPMVLPIVMEV